MTEEQAQRRTQPAGRIWPAFWWLLFAFVISAVVYKDLPRSPFFLDDYLHLHLIRQFKNPFEPFYTDIFMGAFFRPMLTLFWTFDYLLFGLNATGYYILNLVYLFASVALLYAIVHNLTGSHVLSGWTALIFAVNPVTGVGVQWLSNRFDLVGTLFFLLSLLLFLRFVRFRRHGNYALSLFFAVVSFFCKEIAITLPVVLILAAGFMFLYRARPSFNFTLVKRLISFTTPYFLAAVVFMFWRFAVIKSMGGYVGERSESFTFSYFLAYLWSPFGDQVWVMRNPYVFVILLVLISFLLIKQNFYSRNKLFFFGALFALITALPLAMVIKYPAVVSYLTPRFFYLPNIGVVVALVAVYDPQSSKLRRFLALTLLTLLTAFFALNNYIVVHKWYADKTEMADKREEVFQAIQDAGNAGEGMNLVYLCRPGYDVAIDTSLKLYHPEFLDRYYFIKCLDATQVIADKSLYSNTWRLLTFPQSFSRNPCDYGDLKYGVVQNDRQAVMSQIRSNPSVRVLDIDKFGHMVILDVKGIEQMIKARLGIEINLENESEPDV